MRSKSHPLLCDEWRCVVRDEWGYEEVECGV